MRNFEIEGRDIIDPTVRCAKYICRNGCPYCHTKTCIDRDGSKGEASAAAQSTSNSKDTPSRQDVGYRFRSWGLLQNQISP